MYVSHSILAMYIHWWSDDNNIVDIDNSTPLTATNNSSGLDATPGNNNGSAFAPGEDNQLNAAINNSMLVDTGNATIDIVHW